MPTDPMNQLEVLRRQISKTLERLRMLEEQLGPESTFSWVETDITTLMSLVPSLGKEADEITTVMYTAQKEIVQAVFLLGIEVFQRKYDSGFPRIPERIFPGAGIELSDVLSPMANDFLRIHIRTEE